MTLGAGAHPHRVSRPSLVQRVATTAGPPIRWLTRRAPTLVSKVFLHLHRSLVGDVEVPVSLGAFSMAVNPQDNCGGNLYYRGCYEPEQTQRFTELLRAVRPATFIDVGANIGYYTLLAASQGVPRVVAVEASPEIAAMLERNVALNRLSSRVHVVAAALADHDGTLTFWPNREDHNLGTGAVLRRPDLAGDECFEVRCHSGDSLFGDIAAGPVLMKLDVEGGELLVVEGMRGFLTRLRPTLAIEVHPVQLRLMGRTAEQLTAVLSDLGFALARLCDGREVSVSASASFGSDISWLIARPC